MRATRLAAAGMVVLAGLAIGLGRPAPALAADPVFGQATATSAFGDGVTVVQAVTLPDGVRDIEAYVRSNASTTTFLAEVRDPGAGRQTLRYTYATPGGGTYPNTKLELGFRVTLEDGTFIDGRPARITYEDDRFDWRTLEGTTVRIHWYQGDERFGRRALEIGDRAVQEAAALLGVEEKDPIDFFVYGERDAFYDVLGNSIQENVGGLAIPEIRTLFADIAPSEVDDAWVSNVVPHELTHVVFDTATRNDYHEPPHWLNEGLSVYLSEGYGGGRRAAVEAAIRTDDLMPLSALRLQFPSTPDRFSLGYAESVSAIDYLVRAHGQDALVRLIRGYGDGVSDDEAFAAALGVDMAGFEAAWLADLGVQAPVPYGPRPAPVGPLPPGWEPAPAVSAPPVATPPPPKDERAELGTTIAIGVVGLFGIVVVLGILVVGRGLNRGEGLPFGGAGQGPGGAPGRSPGSPRPQPGEWGSGQWAPDREETPPEAGDPTGGDAADDAADGAAPGDDEAGRARDSAP